MNTMVKYAAAAAMALAFTGTAFAVTSDDFKYTTAQDGSAAISPMAMQPDGFTPETPYSVSWLSGYLTVTGTGESGCFNTGVDLPTGAKFTGVRIWTTSTTTSSIFFRFVALPLATGAATTVASSSVGDGSGSRSEAFIEASGTVKDATAYGLGVCLDTGERFNGARIEYTYKNAGE